jgi:hypothetical protein
VPEKGLVRSGEDRSTPPTSSVCSTRRACTGGVAGSTSSADALRKQKLRA